MADPICDMGEITFNPNGDYLGAITRELSNHCPSKDTLTTLYRKSPDMGEM